MVACRADTRLSSVKVALLLANEAFDVIPYGSLFLGASLLMNGLPISLSGDTPKLPMRIELPDHYRATSSKGSVSRESRVRLVTDDSQNGTQPKAFKKVVQFIPEDIIKACATSLLGHRRLDLAERDNRSVPVVPYPAQSAARNPVRRSFIPKSDAF